MRKISLFLCVLLRIFNVFTFYLEKFEHFRGGMFLISYLFHFLLWPADTFAVLHEEIGKRDVKRKVVLMPETSMIHTTLYGR